MRTWFVGSWKEAKTTAHISLCRAKDTQNNNRYELDTVVLTIDLPEEGLKAGDLGAVVAVYGDGAAYEVEFVTLKGQTVSVSPSLTTACGRWTRGIYPPPVERQWPEYA